MRFRVYGLRFGFYKGSIRVSGLGCKVSGSGLGLRLQAVGLRASSRLRVEGLGCRFEYLLFFGCIVKGLRPLNLQGLVQQVNSQLNAS